MGSPDRCKRVAARLLSKHQVYVQPIHFPTVPRGTDRIRLTPGPQHSVEMLEHLVAGLKDVFREVGHSVRGSEVLD